MSKVLFILKRREDFNAQVHTALGLSTGLFNSASFMNEMLNERGIESKMSVVIDNNDIDREVTAFRPTHVIIEALWVVPSKFDILQKLHPNVKWIIRLHSEMPFMAGEGIALNWIGDYGTFRNVSIGVNAPRMLEEIQFYLKTKFGWTDEVTKEKVFYLPNYYPQTNYLTKSIDYTKEHIDVGCFGAIRLLKNHLVQAFGALKLAEAKGKKLNFHINAGRIEMKGDTVAHNLMYMFQHLSDRGHNLVNHQWTPREEFLKLCGTMDVGMQCNFSETFNIVGADFISQGVPLIASKEIPWAHSDFCADPTSSNNLAEILINVYDNPSDNVNKHQAMLTTYTSNTANIWVDYFK